MMSDGFVKKIYDVSGLNENIVVDPTVVFAVGANEDANLDYSTSFTKQKEMWCSFLLLFAVERRSSLMDVGWVFSWWFPVVGGYSLLGCLLLDMIRLRYEVVLNSPSPYNQRPFPLLSHV
jgi:hypothetical protein